MVIVLDCSGSTLIRDDIMAAMKYLYARFNLARRQVCASFENVVIHIAYDDDDGAKYCATTMIIRYYTRACARRASLMVYK